MKKVRVPVVVRCEDMDRLVLVFASKDNLFFAGSVPYRTCFTFKEGHTTISREYYWQKTTATPKDSAEKFVALVQAYYDTLPNANDVLVLRKRCHWHK
jgi:hypothetical protein